MQRILPTNLQSHWKNPKGLIQVILGPRQVGKTTAIHALAQGAATVFASADLPTPPTPEFIISHWQKARALQSDGVAPRLILDEIQKVPRWSETIKSLWDEDRRENRELSVWVLGSSAILIEKGLSESLTGRFEVCFFPHWTYPECHAVFGASIEEYARIGGYPKTYSLRDDPERLLNYVQTSIIETTLGRDILTLHAVDKPALLRQLFWYTSKLPAQIVSFEKILGHLQGKGNSATLAHYAELLEMAFVLLPLSKFSAAAHRTKRSIPKWIIPNPALVDASVREDGLSGFVFENLIGSHLANLLFGDRRHSLHYWREDDHEIDFVLARDQKALLCIEVKSGRRERVTSVEILRKNGIEAPVIVISKENFERFLSATSIQEIIEFVP